MNIIVPVRDHVRIESGRGTVETFTAAEAYELSEELKNAALEAGYALPQPEQPCGAWHPYLNQTCRMAPAHVEPFHESRFLRWQGTRVPDPRPTPPVPVFSVPAAERREWDNPDQHIRISRVLRDRGLDK